VVRDEARALWRDRIEAMAWFAGLPPRRREVAIRMDVARFWPLMIPEAVERIITRAR